MPLSEDRFSAQTPDAVPSGHSVQFYENESFLYSVVGDFFANGFAAGDSALIIATDEHQRAFTDALLARQIDVDRAKASGRLTILDADATLSLFMSGSNPSESLFQNSIRPVLEKCSRGGIRLRAYGEMVDRLWRDGNSDAAIRLEQMWNTIIEAHKFTLLCAYPIANFFKESHVSAFEQICDHHNVVAPAETYVRAEDGARATEISRLQQRAGALAAEVEHRKQLEATLREALAERQRAAENHSFLLDATAALNRSLDYFARLRDTVTVAVPRLADWCAVNVLREDGAFDRVTTHDAYDSNLPRRIAPSSPEHATHTAALASFEPTVVDSGHTVIIPMRSGDRALGTITLQSIGGERHADDALSTALEFARRAGIAIENARLYRLASEANRAKDEFLATISHELRTPLTAILGWARMLTMGDMDPELTRTAIETIERSAKTQANLVNDLLDLSRIVSGKLGLDSTVIDARRPLMAALETVALSAQAREITIETTMPEEFVTVNGDAMRMQQIAWNLLTNAIKFSQNGGTVTMTLTTDNDSAVLTVADRGHGIDADFLPFVFEPFRQGDSSSNRSFGGLGLGLAIVKHLAELHGGSVVAESEGRDRGATFTVRIPRRA